MPAALFIMIKIYKNSKNPNFIPVNTTAANVTADQTAKVGEQML